MKISRCKSTYQDFILIALIIFGPIKGLVNGLFFQIDITLIIFIIAVVDFFLNIKTLKLNKTSLLYLVFLFFLWGIMIISLIYSSSSKISIEKTLKFTIVLFSFMYPLILKRFNILLFYKVILYLVCPLSVLFILYKFWYWSPMNLTRNLNDVFYSFAGAYLSLGFLVALGVFVAVKLKKIYGLVVFIVLLFALGARGPLIFSMLILFFTHYNKIIQLIYAKRRAILLILIILIGLVVFNFNEGINDFLKYGRDRFVSLFEFNKDQSAHSRFEMISFATNEIFGNIQIFFMGNGIGSFGVDYKGIEILEYPHIIFLEVWYELGLLGFLLITLFLITPIFLKRDKLYYSFLLFILLDSLKSNNLLNMWITAILYSIIIMNIEIFYRKDAK